MKFTKLYFLPLEQQRLWLGFSLMQDVGERRTLLCLAIEEVLKPNVGDSVLSALLDFAIKNTKFRYDYTPAKITFGT